MMEFIVIMTKMEKFPEKPMNFGLVFQKGFLLSLIKKQENMVMQMNKGIWSFLRCLMRRKDSRMDMQW